MPAPGSTTSLQDQPTPLSAPTDIGTAFIAVETQRGPHLTPTLVRSLTQFASVYGDRETDSLASDWVETAFREGCDRIYVSRAVGPSPVAAYLETNLTGNNNDLKFTAKYVGSYYHAITVRYVVSGTNTALSVSVSGNAITVNVATDGSGVATSTASEILTAVNASAAAMALLTTVALKTGNDGTGVVTAMSATALASGTDDRANITTTEIDAALDRFEPELGPGQVAIPGRTTAAMHAIVLAHCDSARINRVPRLDAADTPTVATLTTLATTDAAVSGARSAMLLAPWVEAPAITAGGTARLVPPSALVCGLEARNDAAGVSPNQPAAGDFGIARWVSDVSQPAWSETDRTTLNDAGVTVIRNIRGQVQPYGHRSLAASTSNWRRAATGRFAMWLRANAQSRGDRFVHREIGARREAITDLHSTLLALLTDPDEGFPQSLYPRLDADGNELDAGYRVDTGPAVNTDESLNDGYLRAHVLWRPSPSAEFVEISIVNVATTGAIA